MKKVFITISMLLILVACVQIPSTQLPIDETDQIATIVAGTLSAIPSPLPLPTSTFIPALTSTSEPNSDIKWLSVYDPNLQITIQYPTSWTLESSGSGFIRIDAPEKNNINVPYTIQVGEYNTSITPDQTLLSWTEQYEQKSGHSGESIAARESLEINGLDAVYTLLDFPEVSYTNYRHENTVLFVWSNISESAGEIYVGIYKRVAASLTSD